MPVAVEPGISRYESSSASPPSSRLCSLRSRLWKYNTSKSRNILLTLRCETNLEQKTNFHHLPIFGGSLLNRLGLLSTLGDASINPKKIIGVSGKGFNNRCELRFPYCEGHRWAAKAIAGAAVSHFDRKRSLFCSTINRWLKNCIVQKVERLFDHQQQTSSIPSILSKSLTRGHGILR